MNSILCFLFLFYGGYFVCGYLTKPHWNTMNKILQSDLPNNIKKEVKDTIYIHHHNWCNKFTYKFIETNNFKLSKQQISELKTYASLGLCKSIEKYNGTGNFYIYSCIYMKSELYKGITNITPMKLLPHRLRVNKKWKQNNENLYKDSMKKVYCSDKYVKSVAHNLNENNREKIEEALYNLDGDELRLFKYRYDIITFKKINTLYKISQLYCCSIETIRKKLNKIYEKLRYYLL